MKIFSLSMILLSGCSTTPTWSNANATQRVNLWFIGDRPYYNSPQATNDVNDTVDTILRNQ